MGKRPPKSKPTNGKKKSSKGKGAPPGKKQKQLADDLLFEEESSDAGEVVAEEDEDNETADQKRIRLAKDYLKNLELDAAMSEADEGDEMGDAIAHRLQKDLAKSRGRHMEPYANQLSQLQHPPSIRFTKGHRLPVTCVTLSGDDTAAYTGSKDCSIIRWDIETGAKTSVCKRARKQSKGQPEDAMFDQVFALAASDDGRYLASGGRDKRIHVWDTRTNEHVAALQGHRDAVSCLAFRMATSTLYSGSFDRTVRIWNLDNMGFVEQLYGHQAEISAIDSLLDERCVTVGKDKTARLWKIVAETQLLFGGGHTAAVDAVGQLTHDRFLTGSQDGSIALWNVAKKKPEAAVLKAHGGEWIVSAAAQKFSDVAATGSCDGAVRLWHCKGDGPKAKRLAQVLAVPCAGFVNGLQFSKKRRFLVCGVGQEHKFGRWRRIGDSKNGLQVIDLSAADAAV